MPSYELSVLVKVFDRPETVAVLKRIGTALLNKGVVLKQVESLGTKDLPYAIIPDKTTWERHYQGSYFLYKFDTTTSLAKEIWSEFEKDVDLLKAGCVRVQPEFTDACTLDEEFRPPAIRKSVQELLEKDKKNKRRVKPKPEDNHHYFDIHM